MANGSLQEGTATLLGLTPLSDGQLRIIVASGRVSTERAKQLRVSNCVFQFDRRPVRRAFEDWCLAGVNHHAVLMKGEQLPALRKIAHLRNWEFHELGNGGVRL